MKALLPTYVRSPSVPRSSNEVKMKHLQRDLENLQRDLLGMAAAVEEALHKALCSLQNRDLALARQVIAGDSQIDQEENHVEEECLKVLALHQPVAVDLRRVVTVLKINNDLERMASGPRSTPSRTTLRPRSRRGCAPLARAAREADLRARPFDFNPAGPP